MCGGNLPAELTSFVGRGAELVELQALHTSSRLLTLVGSGGVGKTRLALRLAALARARFPDGVWLVELAALTDPLLVPAAVADVFGVPEHSELSGEESLAQALSSKRLLLVLDNCEHVIGPSACLVTRLLRDCPNLHILATSREDLRVESEVAWRVPPLSLPCAASAQPLYIETSDAVCLFVERLRAAQPTFSIDSVTAVEVAGICQRLDGLPLAIELAAARAASLGVASVAARLDRRLAVLVGGAGVTPPRHQTLRAALDWSYELLDEEERILLRRLAVFAGGWTLEAAESVCSGPDQVSGLVVDVLARLVTRSLVQVDHQDAGRYRFLSLVHEYAQERLEAAGEAALLQTRHAQYVLDLAERVPPEASDAAHAKLLEREQGNLRAALRWTHEHGAVELGLRLASAAFNLWYFRGHYAEGSGWLERLLARHGDRPTAESGEARVWAGQLLQLQGRFVEAETLLRVAVEQHRAGGDPRGLALSTLILGNAALWRGDLPRAGPLLSEAAVRLRQLDNPAELVAVFQCALLACELGQMDRARDLTAECAAMGRRRQLPVATAAALHLRALITARSPDASTTLQVMGDALELERRVPDQQRLVQTLTELGHVLLDARQAEHALDAFAEALQLPGASGERVYLVRALEGLGRAIAGTDVWVAIQLAACADAWRVRHAVLAWPSDQQRSKPYLATAERTLGSHGFARAWAIGRELNTDEAVDLALAASARARAELHDADGQYHPLTPREEDVAVLVARGLPNRVIAAELQVSTATVRVHVDHILAKLALHSRTQVAMWAIKRGMLVEQVRRMRLNQARPADTRGSESSVL